MEFDANGDTVHVHKVITTAYPPFRNTGGYTLLRLDGKRLIVIDDEINGVDVVFFLTDPQTSQTLHSAFTERHIVKGCHSISGMK